MPISWEISATLAAAALLALGVVAGLTLMDVRRTLRNVTELSAAAERHLPAIRQNVGKIRHDASVLTSSIQMLSRKASVTAEGFEGISRDIRFTINALETEVIEPGLKIMKVLSTLLAFTAVIRRLRHPLGPVRRRGKGRA